MDFSKFLPDPLFYTLGFRTREIKATEKVLNDLYKAGYLGLKRPEAVATYCNMTVSEYRQLIANDPNVENMFNKGKVDSETRTSIKLIEQVEEGNIKAIQLKLTHQHDWMPAKPEASEDNTLVIRVENAEPEFFDDDN